MQKLHSEYLYDKNVSYFRVLTSRALKSKTAENNFKFEKDFVWDEKDSE